VVRASPPVGILTRADLLRHVRRTHWTCDWCATFVIGLRRPNACPQCGGESWTFEVVPR
jgi:rubrerythrin